jgi:hypothetical protein
MLEIVDWRRMPKDQSIGLVLDAQSRNLRGVEFVLQDHIVRASATLGRLVGGARRVVSRWAVKSRARESGQTIFLRAPLVLDCRRRRSLSCKGYSALNSISRRI